MWNIQAAYQWQLGREAGQDFSADDTLSYDMVHREYRLAIEAFDRAAKNTKVPGENWSFTAHGLRLSLILTTASASERVQSGVSKAEAMEIILNALKPIAALYQSDPQSPFFDYMRSLGNTVDTSALVAVLEGADDSESMAMLRALEW